MRRIPFIGAVILTDRERRIIMNQLVLASQALADSSALNITAAFKIREYQAALAQQSEAAMQIMQINLLITDALGRVRVGEDVDEVLGGLEAQLSEFGGDGLQLDSLDE